MKDVFAIVVLFVGMIAVVAALGFLAQAGCHVAGADPKSYEGAKANALWCLP